MRYLMLCLILLTGCSSSAPRFILAPQLYWPQSNQLSKTSFAFNVADERSRAYSLRVQNGSDIQYINTSNDLRFAIESNMAQAFKSQGAVLSQDSLKRVTVKINQLQSLVDQRTIDHLAVNQVTLSLFIEHNHGTYSKTYSGESSFTAPFRMDVAAVERELRVLTEQVMGKILSDTSWHQAIRS